MSAGILSTKDRVLSVLYAYGFKRVSIVGAKEEWRGNSPFRPNSDSQAFAVVFDDDEHGAYHDHVSGDKGSLYDLARALNIEPNAERKQAEQTKRVYRDLADYAGAHGIPAEAMKGWSDVRVVDDNGKQRPALTFKTPSGERYRFIDGEKPYYKPVAKSGYKACWYGLRSAIEMAKEKNTPIVLCNGEVSTLAAQYHGIPAACVTSGEKAIPPDLLAQLNEQWQGTVIIAMDCDVTGIEVAQKIKKQLVNRDALVVDLGLTDGGDLADFARLYTESALTELIKRATPKVAPPPPQTTPAQELAATLRELEAERRKEQSAERDASIDHLLARVQAITDTVRSETARPLVVTFADAVRQNREQLMFKMQNPQEINGLVCKIRDIDKITGGFTPELYTLYGATSMGKSTLMASFAKSLLEQAPGFFVTTESDPRRFLNKIVAAVAQVPIDLIETGRLDKVQYEKVMEAYTWFEKMGCGMLNAASPTPAQVRAAVLDGIDKRGYEFVIVDSASKMSAGAGYSGIYETTKRVSDGLQDLWREFNIPVLITTQVGRDVGERAHGKKIPIPEDGYGGGAIEQNAGVLLAVYRHDYYVKLGTEPINDKQFPPNSALVRCLKHRWRDSAGRDAMVLMVGGAGFYQMERRTVDFANGANAAHENAAA